MKKIQFPVLSKIDTLASYPKDGKCPVCMSPFKGSRGIAYLNGGSLWVNDEGKSISSISGLKTQPETFFHLGYHGCDIEDRDSVDAEIVDHVRGQDQFDLSFCSLKCLRAWLNTVLDQLEAELQTGLRMIELGQHFPDPDPNELRDLEERGLIE